MTLAPIRGAPPGASIPDFPANSPKAEALPTTTVPVSEEPHRLPPTRQPYTPVKISGGGTTLTLTVIPEQPAISRASMIIHAAVESPGLPSRTIGFLRMSANTARTFLAEVQKERTPILVTGDEDGTVQIEYEITVAGHVFLVRTSGQRLELSRCIIDKGFDLKAIAYGLLADLGA
jgi:hypothetical protein